MAFTYGGDPSANNRDKVRFLIGDTDSTNPLLQDAEILFLFNEWNSNAYIAAAHACDSLAAKFAGKADNSKSVGDLSISTQFGQQADRYRSLGAQLLAQASQITPPSPSVFKDKDGNVFGPEKFRIGMGDYV